VQQRVKPLNGIQILDDDGDKGYSGIHVFITPCQPAVKPQSISDPKLKNAPEKRINPVPRRLCAFHSEQVFVSAAL
jgi:hypothetical protein